MKKLPTDLEILDAIYEEYYDAFTKYSDGDASRATKIYVPIDVPKIAGILRVDNDIIFARLHYYLEHRYGYENKDHKRVSFFANRLTDNESHSINFPYMASILADLRNEQRKHRRTITIAVVSLILSISSFSLSLAQAIGKARGEAPRTSTAKLSR